MAGKFRVGVKDHLDLRDILHRDTPESGGDALNSLSPILPPVAGHEQALARLAARLGDQLPAGRKGGVDPAVSGDVDVARHALAAEVGGAELGRGEEQLGKAVDRDPELFLRPWPAPVVASQPCLDMRDRDSGSPRGERAAERARRVALDDDQGRIAASSAPEHRLGHPRDVRVRVWRALAAQLQCSSPGQGELIGVEAGMLTGEDKQGEDRALFKRVDYRRKLDRFGTRADHGDN